MRAEILRACLPALIALAVAWCLAWGLLRLSGARWRWARWRELGACDAGAVQSLSFVITLPVFIMLVLFIIQVCQLLTGQILVHYAAYAGVRSAVVWIPSELGPVSGEPANVIRGYCESNGDVWQIRPEGADFDSVKYQRIRGAVVAACAVVSPSRDLNPAGADSPQLDEAIRVTTLLYPLLAPGSQTNTRIPRRIENKLRYADRNTFVAVEWREARHPHKDVEIGPSYNPRNHPAYPDVPPFNPNEVGFRDAVTVRVAHRYALLPGPGRFLIGHLVDSRGRDLITADAANYDETVYTTVITASATMVNEGFKSMIPHLPGSSP